MVVYSLPQNNHNGHKKYKNWVGHRVYDLSYWPVTRPDPAKIGYPVTVTRRPDFNTALGNSFVHHCECRGGLNTR